MSQTALRAATFKGWRNCCHRREMLLVTLVAACCETFLNREMWIVNRNCLGCVHGTGMARCFFSYLLLLLPSLPLNFFFFKKMKMIKIEKNVRCVFFSILNGVFLKSLISICIRLARKVDSCFSVTLETQHLANSIRQVHFLEIW